MFEVGFWEITLIGVIALLVIGPERLPSAARTIGLYVGRIRRYVTHVQQDIQRELNADELRNLVDNPAGDALSGLREVVDETKDALGSMRDELHAAERSAEGLGKSEDWANDLHELDDAGSPSLASKNHDLPKIGDSREPKELTTEAVVADDGESASAAANPGPSDSNSPATLDSVASAGPGEQSEPPAVEPSPASTADDEPMTRSTQSARPSHPAGNDS